MIVQLELYVFIWIYQGWGEGHNCCCLQHVIVQLDVVNDDAARIHSIISALPFFLPTGQMIVEIGDNGRKVFAAVPFRIL
jgi:hypothetical protein